LHEASKNDNGVKQEERKKVVGLPDLVGLDKLRGVSNEAGRAHFRQLFVDARNLILK
jgi:hypothetical protein